MQPCKHVKLLLTVALEEMNVNCIECHWKQVQARDKKKKKAMSGSESAEGLIHRGTYLMRVATLRQHLKISSEVTWSVRDLFRGFQMKCHSVELSLEKQQQLGFQHREKNEATEMTQVWVLSWNVTQTLMNTSEVSLWSSYLSAKHRFFTATEVLCYSHLCRWRACRTLSGPGRWPDPPPASWSWHP